MYQPSQTKPAFKADKPKNVCSVIGLFVSLAFIGAHFQLSTLKELTNRHEPLFSRTSSAACVASQANTILDIAQAITWAYKLPRIMDVSLHPLENLQCHISREELITERGLTLYDGKQGLSRSPPSITRRIGSR
ncbi:hypothetical protein BDV29DRAFT_152989 [Aspergillus leporis]|uniref:Uncharacterized protein n=1 Tax=Aspergillus leporis TaxID=41062 RepID=A0A5N5XGT6_9EURO|nr:hypothetical protein BDV29DRAFT_152989 [Aspergillus leporis]